MRNPPAREGYDRIDRTAGGSSDLLATATVVEIEFVAVAIAARTTVVGRAVARRVAVDRVAAGRAVVVVAVVVAVVGAAVVDKSVCWRECSPRTRCQLGSNYSWTGHPFDQM